MASKSRVAAAILASLALLMLAVGVGSASAQEQESRTHIAVTGVNATDDQVELRVLRADYTVTTAQIDLTENGEPISDVELSTATELGLPIEVVYVLDVDNRSVVNAGLSTITSGVIGAVADLPSDIRVGVVTAGNEAEVLTRPTTNRTRIRTALQGIAAEEGAALLDAVALASESFSDRADVIKTVVVVSTGPDTASQRAVPGAESAVVQAGAQALWVGLGESVAGLNQIVDRTGGVVVGVGDVLNLATGINDATTVATDRLVLSYTGTAERGERVAVDLTVADNTIGFSYPVGVETDNALQLTAIDGPAPIERGFFGQPAVMYASVALAFLAIALAVWTIGSVFAGGETSLDSLLARYSDRDETLEEDDVQEMLVQTALIRRAVDMTETFAERRGFLVRAEELLEKANVPVGAGEGMFFLSALSVVATGLAMLVTGSVFAGLLTAVLVGVGGYGAVVLLAKRRLSQFQSQLPDTLQLLAGTLRAGYSLPQGLDAVSTEIADPMGHELRRAITESQLGRELEEALAGVAERLDSPDFAWAVMAIGIQREVGGNLAEVLLTVSETMIQRDRLAREVSALTAEGRVSAGILSMLPPGLGLVMWVMNPGYIGILFQRTIGLVLIGLAVVSGLVGLMWMKKVITIDV